MTLEKIRAALPTHIMLTPGTPLRKGDETLEFDEADYGEWQADVYPEGHGVGGFTHARRPVPPRILDNQAFYLWAGQYGGVVPTWENDADVRKHIEKGRLYDKWLLEQMEGI